MKDTIEDSIVQLAQAKLNAGQSTVLGDRESLNM